MLDFFFSYFLLQCCKGHLSRHPSILTSPNRGLKVKCKPILFLKRCPSVLLGLSNKDRGWLRDEECNLRIFLKARNKDNRQKSFLVGDLESVMEAQRTTVPGRCAPFLFP